MTPITRPQLEALRDADKAGKLPHAFIGLRMVSFGALASQLLAAMDELETLKAADAAGKIGL